MMIWHLIRELCSDEFSSVNPHIDDAVVGHVIHGILLTMIQYDSVLSPGAQTLSLTGLFYLRQAFFSLTIILEKASWACRTLYLN